MKHALISENNLSILLDALEDGSPLSQAIAIKIVKSLKPSEAVAWCSISVNLQHIHYFDGKPMIMVGSIGNDHHQTALYALDQVKE